MHRVVVPLFPGVVAFDAAVPLQVFGHPDERDLYDVRVCAPSSGPIPTVGGLDLVAARGLGALRRADTVVVPGVDDPARETPLPLLRALGAAHRRGARLVSICTGAFILAEAGVLSGGRATTHWRDAALLAERYPDVDVDPDALYVDGGRVLTSAGVAAGIDLCLHIMRGDHGARRANSAARRMMVAPHRDGGQAQFVERPVPDRERGGLTATREWMLTNLDAALSVADMAAHAVMSERSFSRHFTAETGSTPLAWLNEQRVLQAQRLLEETALPITEVAAECGFGTLASFRQHFGRRLHTSPSAYRSTFRHGAAREVPSAG